MFYTVPLPAKKAISHLSGASLSNGLRDAVDASCTTSYPLTKTFLWALFQDDYEKAVSTVKANINYNRVGGEYCKYNNCWPIITGLDTNCTDLAQISCIMNSYYKAALAGKVLEYDPSRLYDYNQSKSWTKIAAECETTVQYVTRITGQAYFRVKEVLNHLYWATWAVDSSDRLRYQYIAPVQYAANVGQFSKPDDPNFGSGVTTASNSAASVFDGLITAGKWILIVGGIGVAAYFLFPLVTSLKK